MKGPDFTCPVEEAREKAFFILRPAVRHSLLRQSVL